MNVRRWTISALATGSAFALGIANNVKQPVWFVTSVAVGALQAGAVVHLGQGKGPLHIPGWLRAISVDTWVMIACTLVTIALGALSLADRIPPPYLIGR